MKIEKSTMSEANKQVQALNYDNSVDLLLIMDCTGSMRNWID